MNHHAYFVVGDRERGVEAALLYGQNVLSLESNSADAVVLRYEAFSVEDARALSESAYQSGIGAHRLLVVATRRIYHEAQNALLKLFEEPPQGVTLILVIPGAGDLIPTLRSRLLPLPKEEGGKKEASIHSDLAREFLEASTALRAKMVSKLLERAKSDKPQEKQAARADALALAEDLARTSYQKLRSLDSSHGAPTSSPRQEITAFLKDLDRLIPVLHERAAPLKPILEHLLLTVPSAL
ncbi:MAG: hypothetical protein WBK28_00665 [Minisyncoccia bacterium]